MTEMKTVIEFVTDLTRVIRNTDLDDPVQFAAFRQVAEERIQQYADEQSIEFAEWALDDVAYPVNKVDIEQMLKEYHESQKP